MAVQVMIGSVITAKLKICNVKLKVQMRDMFYIFISIVQIETEIKNNQESARIFSTEVVVEQM